jgi:hypothetical protein
MILTSSAFEDVSRGSALLVSLFGPCIRQMITPACANDARALAGRVGASKSRWAVPHESIGDKQI